MRDLSSNGGWFYDSVYCGLPFGLPLNIPLLMYNYLYTNRSTYSLWAWKYAVKKRIPAASIMEGTGPSPGVLRPASPMVDSFISCVSFSSTRRTAFACVALAVYLVICLCSHYLFPSQYHPIWSSAFSCSVLFVYLSSCAAAGHCCLPVILRGLHHLPRLIFRDLLEYLQSILRELYQPVLPA